MFSDRIVLSDSSHRKRIHASRETTTSGTSSRTDQYSAVGAPVCVRRTTPFCRVKANNELLFSPFFLLFFLINFSLSPASTLFRCNSQENFRYRFRFEHSFHWDKVSKKLFKMIKRIKRVDPPNERNYRSTRRLMKKFFSQNVSNENVIFLFESRVWKI